MLLALSNATYVLIGWFKFLLLKFLYEYWPWHVFQGELEELDRIRSGIRSERLRSERNRHKDLTDDELDDWLQHLIVYAESTQWPDRRWTWWLITTPYSVRGINTMTWEMMNLMTDWMPGGTINGAYFNNIVISTSIMIIFYYWYVH